MIFKLVRRAGAENKVTDALPTISATGIDK